MIVPTGRLGKWSVATSAAWTAARSHRACYRLWMILVAALVALAALSRRCSVFSHYSVPYCRRVTRVWVRIGISDRDSRCSLGKQFLDALAVRRIDPELAHRVDSGRAGIVHPEAIDALGEHLARVAVFDFDVSVSVGSM